MTLSRGRSGLRRSALAGLCACALLVQAVPGGVRAQEAAFAVQDVTLRDVALDLAGAHLTAPVLTASGTGLSKEALLAILSADGKEPWPARLAKLDAASIAMPELRVERTGASRQLMVYRDVVAKGVHAGRIGELTAAGAALTVTALAGGPAGDGTSAGAGSYGGIRAEEVDLAALAAVSTKPGDGKDSNGKGSDGGGPWRRLVGAVSIANIAFTNAQGTRVGIDRISGRDLSRRPMPTTGSDVLGALAAFDPERTDPAARARAAGVIADALDSVSVGSLEATGLRVQDAEPGKNASGREGAPADIAVGRLAYASSGADAGLSLSDLRFSGAGARLGVTRLGLAGFSLQPTVASLRQMAGGPPAGGETPQADLRRLTPLIGTLTLTGFELDLDGDAAAAPAREGGVKQAAPSADPLVGRPAPDPRTAPLHVGLREATMTFGPPQDGVPTASRIALGGLSLPASVFAGAPVLGSLGTYGYRDLDLDLAAESAWNEASREVALRDVSLKGRDIGSLHLSGVIGGVGPDVFDPDAAVSGLAMLSTTAKALTLQIENGGLYERFIDATAKSLSLKPDELRKEYVTACLIGIPVILGNSPAAKAIGAAMGKFAAKPGILSISARAKNGSGLGVVDFSTAPTPAAMLDKLDVTAKAD